MTKIQKNSRDEESINETNKKTIGQFIYEVCFSILILFVIIGSYLMYFQLDQYMESISSNNIYYKFPKKSDLLYALYSFLLFVFFYHLSMKILNSFTGNLLLEKYVTGNERIHFNYYRDKVSIYFIKLFILFTITVLGHYILRDLTFFPWSLGGKGEYRNMFTGKNMYFFEKTPYFDLYYNLNLGWAIFDTYLVLILPRQSDFLIMILHHLATISLIAFSYLTNYSNIGCVVFYLHYFGDAFGYILRLFVYIKVPAICKYISGFSIVFLFSYTRLYVFGSVLLDTYYYLEFWGVIEKFCFTFEIFLYNLHILWYFLICNKFYKWMKYGEAEELYKPSLKKKQ